MDLSLPLADRGGRSFPVFGKTWFVGAAVVLVTCVLPFLVLAFLPVWNVYRRRRRLRDEAQRRALASDLAKTIRKSYLLGLAEDYSTILSESDILDEYESEEEDTNTAASELGGSTTDTTISSGSSSSTRTCADNSATIPFSSSDDFTESNGDTSSTSTRTSADTSTPIQDGDDNDDIDIDIEMQKQSDNDNDNDNDSTNEHQDDNTKDIIGTPTPRTANSEDGDGDNANRAHCQTIYVPPPGQRNTSETATDNNDNRHGTTKTASVAVAVSARSGGCAVCLNAFCAHQTVTWSSNPDCPHVFHHQCLMDWYTAVGTKAFLGNHDHDNYDNQTQAQAQAQPTLQRIGDFPTLCPCCRREFFLDKEKAKQECRATKHP
mmetsp:Transcript_15177/g.32614  ORF Transcript_15177/g.32614 Transcript_15177/m.32614 type:complete len:377 (-) Transcript_15177:282-1412(-)